MLLLMQTSLPALGEARSHKSTQALNALRHAGSPSNSSAHERSLLSSKHSSGALFFDGPTLEDVDRSMPRSLTMSSSNPGPDGGIRRCRTLQEQIAEVADRADALVAGQKSFDQDRSTPLGEETNMVLSGQPSRAHTGTQDSSHSSSKSLRPHDSRAHNSSAALGILRTSTPGNGTLDFCIDGAICDSGGMDQRLGIVLESTLPEASISPARSVQHSEYSGTTSSQPRSDAVVYHSRGAAAGKARKWFYGVQNLFKPRGKGSV
mmetsp:Transcript_16729/g.50080  ORF Transcript_16729/g.50080 Transcript_16729/m.50080 type:complete len:263 (-) Transcript_16729:4027-4815(-)